MDSASHSAVKHEATGKKWWAKEERRIESHKDSAAVGALPLAKQSLVDYPSVSMLVVFYQQPLFLGSEGRL